MKTILTVCTANICRSPMVAAVLQARLAVAGLTQQAQVHSAGVYALEGQPAARFGRELLAARGIDLSAHRATQIQEARIYQADLIIVMEENHRRQLFHYAPDQSYKVILFSELIGEHGDLADPYGHEVSAYQLTLQRIDEVLERGWDRLLARLKLTPPATA
jgi:protein-tyrosine phosphatase